MVVVILFASTFCSAISFRNDVLFFAEFANGILGLDFLRFVFGFIVFYFDTFVKTFIHFEPTQ